MKGWIIYRQLDAIRNKEYIDSYIEEGEKLQIEIILIIVEKLQFGVNNNTWFIKEDGQVISQPDFAISRTIYPLLTKQLEYMGIMVYNNSSIAELCNDKAKTYQCLAGIGIQIIDTEFYQHQYVPQVINNQETSNPNKMRVIKTVDGHGGNQVFLLESGLTEEEGSELIEKMDKSDVVVQPLIGTRSQDLRVYVIGNTIIAAVLRTALSGFKSNYSLGGHVNLYELNQEEIRIVNKIIDQFDFGLVGIDFIIANNGDLIFNEIEDVVGSRMLYQCSTINIVKLYLEHIKRNILL